MGEYTFKLVESEVYEVTVIADSEEEAVGLAYEEISTEYGKSEHHNDSDGHYEIINLDE